jgi:hypothetical protein
MSHEYWTILLGSLAGAVIYYLDTIYSTRLSIVPWLLTWLILQCILITKYPNPLKDKKLALVLYYQALCIIMLIMAVYTSQLLFS